LGLFRSARANGDPYLTAGEAAKHGEVLAWQRVGRGSYLPHFLIFNLIFIITSEDSGSEGVSSPRTLAAA
jgi:hypothetical protein